MQRLFTILKWENLSQKIFIQRTIRNFRKKMTPNNNFIFWEYLFPNIMRLTKIVDIFVFVRQMHMIFLKQIYRTLELKKKKSKKESRFYFIFMLVIQTKK